MARIELDFRFIRTTYELWALGEYLTVSKSQLAIIRAELPEHLAERMSQALSTNDESEVSGVGQEVFEVQEKILPRFHTNSAVLAIYSTIEFCLKDIVRVCQKHLAPKIKLSDLRADNILKLHKKFFERVLDIPFCANNQDWEQLRDLAAVRNCIAHDSGRINLLQGERKEHLQRLIDDPNSGVDTESWDETLMVDETFLDRSFQAAKRLIEDLIGEVKTASQAAGWTPQVLELD